MDNAFAYQSAWSPDGRYVAYQTDDELGVYDVVTGVHASLLSERPGVLAPRYAWSTGSDVLVFIEPNVCTLSVWDAATGEVTVSSTSDRPSCSADPKISASGRFVTFVGDSDRLPAPINIYGERAALYAWDWSADLLVMVTDGAHGIGGHHEWSHTGDRLVATELADSYQPQRTVIMDLPSPEREVVDYSLEIPRNGLAGSWSPLDGYILVSNSDGYRLVDTATSSIIDVPNSSSNPDATLMAWLSDDSALLSGGTELSHWTPAEETVSSVMPYFTDVGSIHQVTISPDGRTVLWQETADGPVSGWKADTGPFTPEFRNSLGEFHYQSNGEWSPDGSRLAFSTGENRIQIWDRLLNDVLPPLPADFGPESWAVDGSLLAMSNWSSGTYAVWEPSTGQQSTLVTGETDPLASASDWSPEGARLLFDAGVVPDESVYAALSMWEMGPPLPPPPPDNQPPTWIEPTPLDGTRFDMHLPSSGGFTLRAMDPDGDAVTIDWELKPLVFGGTVPDGISCVEMPQGGEVACAVAPTLERLGFLDVSVRDSAGEFGEFRRYLVGASAYKYVALGDSYSAGEGVDPYFRDGWHPKRGVTGTIDNRCHRSKTGAYSALVAPPGFTAPLFDLTSGALNERFAPGLFWAFWACSGATINELDTTAPHQDRYPALQNAAVDPATDLVTVTIGGNDVGFSEVMSSCATSYCLDTTLDGKSFHDALVARVAELRPRLVAIYRKIAAQTAQSRILVVGYPYLLPDAYGGRTSCAYTNSAGKVGFDSAEQQELHDLTDLLNDTIRSAAQSAGVEFVDMRDHFSDHEACGSGTEWINGPSFTGKFVQKSKIRIDDETFHPNPIGQCQYAVVINRHLGSPEPSC